MNSQQTGTAIVTGGAKRIGRAISLDLAAAGWAVGVHYNTSADEAAQLVGEIISMDGRAAAVRADLAIEDEVASLISRTAEELGPVSCLVNNASVFESDTAKSATRHSWNLHMEVNLRAPFVLTQTLAAALPDGIDGNVINLIDQRVVNLTPYFTSYTLSKAGLWTLTQTLATALAPSIRVNAIGPGPTLPSSRQSADQFERQFEAMPLGRSVDVEEICAGVRFILASPSMTGQIIVLDAGQHLGWAQPGKMILPDE